MFLDEDSDLSFVAKTSGWMFLKAHPDMGRAKKIDHISKLDQPMSLNAAFRFRDKFFERS